jgi:adenosylhomocysteine nucleosidase
MVPYEWLCAGEGEAGQLKSRIAIVAAMAGELRPLIRGWKLESEAGGVTVYSSAKAVAVFAGLGRERARLATAAALRFGPIRRIVSAGWAGGLHAGMVPGEVWRVRTVVDAVTGTVFEAQGLDGTKELGSVLVTTDHVASAEDKRQVSKIFFADLVDMEAAAVAATARSREIPFSAIKAVSDGHDFDLPGLGKFTTPEGGFRQRTFAAYVALRPVLWKPVARLARDSAAAARNLGKELERWLAEDGE